MTDTPKISLAQQVEAVRFAAVRQASLANGVTVKGLRPKSVEQYDHQRLIASWQTLQWLADNEAEIRAALAERRQRQALKVTPEDRHE